MTTGQESRQNNVSLPPLTHERLQELKQTPQGQRIMQEAFQVFPELVKSLTANLQEKLTRYEQARTKSTGIPDGLTLSMLVDDYQFLEFVQHIMFVKWREEKNSRYYPVDKQVN
ncbi:hypothetical protein HF329_14685 [Chitinophaga oryzae]|uniref:Uncharacterized protein n=1 Tax=Chitinophaga oryzae TaxID=2725414 RepID=A0AAE6ZGY6_9BACT|nr:hypothetical protein [Chitinophaga oryzae]QJB32501.1 hypothetical protein HF329_14685 [Chitinophaga oryzae]